MMGKALTGKLSCILADLVPSQDRLFVDENIVLSEL